MPTYWKAAFFVLLLLGTMLGMHASYATQQDSGFVNGTATPYRASFNATNTHPSALNPPLQQTRAGIPPQEVTCSQGMVLIQNAHDNSPACVNPDTAQKLVARGWGKLVSHQNPFALSRVSDFRAGETVGAFTISEINNENVTGYYNSPYPIQHSGPGVFTTMHVGDTLNPTCDGSAPLVITSINYPDSITVTMGKPTTPRPGGCPICLSADSMIETPSGEVNIKDVRDGMTVWSTDSDGNIIKSKVAEVHHTFVGTAHRVIDLRLADGRELFASPNHPTYDGGSVAGLRTGQEYDGSAVKSASLVPYKYEYTYDILPDSPTGNYFANGILVGSTLK